MPKAARPIRIDGDLAYVTLTKGLVAVIDAADVPLVDGVNWCASGPAEAVYAARSSGRVNGRQEFILMHRLLVGTAAGLHTDHIDGNGLNNRRSNLRQATPSENACNRGISKRNSSGAKGVCFAKDTGKWQAAIRVAGILMYLGQFKCRTGAALAYAKASKQMHGQFGRVD
jgi:hypothetical protein